MSQLAHRAGAYPAFRSMKRISTPPGQDASTSQVTPSNLLGFPQQFAGTHLYSWVEGGTVSVKFLAQEHNTMSPARARTRTTRSGDERTNHQATPPPIGQYTVPQHILCYIMRLTWFHPLPMFFENANSLAMIAHFMNMIMSAVEDIKPFQ